MGFKSSTADPDVWMRPAVKQDSEKYYEYILMYVDNIIAISIDPKAILSNFEQDFKFKNDKVEEPTIYLGARLEPRKINDHECWTMTSVDYVKAAVANVEEKLAKTGKKLPSKVPTPMTLNYVPELDGTPELNEDDTTYFQELIGVLRWATEI